MKLCGRCNRDLPLEAFPRSKTKANGIGSWCRECVNAYSRERYAENTEVRKRHAIAAYEANRKRMQEIRDYKEANPCVDCGVYESYYLMEFDHLRDKVMNISTMVRKHMAIERIWAEIAKCELVCCRCHRIRTHLRLNTEAASIDV